MKIPFNILDFLDRAKNVHGDRTDVIDEPDQSNRIARRRACRTSQAIRALHACGAAAGRPSRRSPL